MQEIPWYKKRPVWFTIGGILLFLIGWGLGQNNAKVTMGDEKATYDKLINEISAKEEQLSKLQSQSQYVSAEIENQQDKIDEAAQYFDKRDDLESELTDLTNQINSKKNEIETLDSDIASKQEELNSLTGKIQETGEAPIELGAGYYYFGKDVPPGRYDLRPQPGQYGNVFVRGLEGISKVGETFGRDELQSFVFEGLEGEEIEATIPIILVPVK